MKLIEFDIDHTLELEVGKSVEVKEFVGKTVQLQTLTISGGNAMDYTLQIVVEKAGEKKTKTVLALQDTETKMSATAFLGPDLHKFPEDSTIYVTLLGPEGARWGKVSSTYKSFG